MIATTKYSSRFFKADTRNKESIADYTVYTSGVEGHITVRDFFLTAGASVQLDIVPGRDLIFPIVGTITVSVENEMEQVVAPGEVYLLADPAHSKVSVNNPFHDEVVNFLVIRLENARLPETGDVTAYIDLAEKNRLVHGGGFASNMSVGVYDSRVKDTYRLREAGNSLFAYIINGSFELEERLMEYRDGLFLWDISEIDFESLSEIAILLIIECSPFKN